MNNGSIDNLLGLDKEGILRTVSVPWLHEHANSLGRYVDKLPIARYGAAILKGAELKEDEYVCVALGFRDKKTPTLTEGAIADFLGLLQVEKGISYWDIVMHHKKRTQC